MADLTWSIEKIVDCKGNDITSGGWVTVSPTNGVGDTHSSITVEPSTRYNDCETATITIATSTGEKKYVTINRCNPQCDCNAVNFIPNENIEPVGEDGGIVEVATYTMNNGCPDVYLKVFPEKGKADCVYNVSNGSVLATVDKNTSMTNDREFGYYVTYSGETCDYKGSFVQNKSTDPCENETCENVSIEPGDINVSFQGETVTVSLNASDCWYVSEKHETYGGAIEKVTFNNDMTESYVVFSKNYSEEERDGIIKYYFTNRITGKECEEWLTYKQDYNPNPPKLCDNCEEINIDDIAPYPIPATINRGDPVTKIAYLKVDCVPSSSIVSFKKIIGQDILKVSSLYQINGMTLIAIPTADIKDNTTYPDDINETIGIYVNNDKCSEFTITQAGTGHTPTPVVCDCTINNFEIKTDVNSNGKATISIYRLTDNDLCESIATVHGAIVKYTYDGDYSGSKMFTCNYSKLKTSAGLTFTVMEGGFAEGKSIGGTLSIQVAGCPESIKTFENVNISRGEQRNTTVKIRLGREDNSCNSNCSCQEISSTPYITKIESDVAFTREIHFVPQKIYFGTCNGVSVEITNATGSEATLSTGQTQGEGRWYYEGRVGTTGQPARYPGGAHVPSGEDFEFSTMNSMPTAIMGTDGILYNITYQIRADLTKKWSDIII